MPRVRSYRPPRNSQNTAGELPGSFPWLSAFNDECTLCRICRSEVFICCRRVTVNRSRGLHPAGVDTQRASSIGCNLFASALHAFIGQRRFMFESIVIGARAPRVPLVASLGLHGVFIALVAALTYAKVLLPRSEEGVAVKFLSPPPAGHRMPLLRQPAKARISRQLLAHKLI